MTTGILIYWGSSFVWGFFCGSVGWSKWIAAIGPVVVGTTLGLLGILN